MKTALVCGLALLSASMAFAQQPKPPEPQMPKSLVVELTGQEATIAMKLFDIAQREKGIAISKEVGMLVDRFEVARQAALQKERQATLITPPVSAPMPQIQPPPGAPMGAPMPPLH